MKSVLIADDDRILRKMLTVSLENASDELRIFEAEDGQVAIDILEAGEKIDLVITDINMPRLDGVSMLKSMRQTGREEKIIIMTGNPSDQRLMDKDLPQIVTRLDKPFGIEKFLNVVIAATNNHKDGALQNQAHTNAYM